MSINRPIFLATPAGVPVRSGAPLKDWSAWQKLTLRVFFVYFLLLIIPIDPTFYEELVSIDWLHLKQRNLHRIAIYFPWFANNSADWDFIGMGLALGGSILAGVLWGLMDKKRKNYDLLYYLLSIILRYRIALAMFHFGWAKAIPLQMGFPSISALNTNLGDFGAAKLFRLTVGVAPGYEIFTGIMELIGALLLLSRRTAVTGSLWLLAILVPVTAINFTYDYGVHMKCINLLLMLFFLLAPHAGKLWALVLDQKAAHLVYRYPQLDPTAYHRGRLLALGLMGLFFVSYGFLVARKYLGYEEKPYTHIALAPGYYLVKGFKKNGVEIPFSPRDSVRWQNLVVEQDNIVSIKQASPIKLLADNQYRGLENFTTAGRHYFGYRANAPEQFVLYSLADRDKAPQYNLSIKKTGRGTVVLTGTCGTDRLEIVLEKTDKKYPLLEGKKTGAYTSI